jgi:hypothetical protein
LMAGIMKILNMPLDNPCIWYVLLANSKIKKNQYSRKVFICQQ